MRTFTPYSYVIYCVAIMMASKESLADFCSKIRLLRTGKTVTSDSIIDPIIIPKSPDESTFLGLTEYQFVFWDPLKDELKVLDNRSFAGMSTSDSKRMYASPSHKSSRKYVYMSGFKDFHVNACDRYTYLSHFYQVDPDLKIHHVEIDFYTTGPVSFFEDSETGHIRVLLSGVNEKLPLEHWGKCGGNDTYMGPIPIAIKEIDKNFTVRTAWVSTSAGIAKFSPDGQKVGYSDAGKLFLMDSHTFKSVPLFAPIELPDGSTIQDFYFTASGNNILIQGNDSYVTGADATSGTILYRFPIDGQFQLSHCGKEILYSKGGTLHLADVRNGRDLQNWNLVGMGRFSPNDSLIAIPSDSHDYVIERKSNTMCAFPGNDRTSGSDFLASGKQVAFWHDTGMRWDDMTNPGTYARIYEINTDSP